MTFTASSRHAYAYCWGGVRDSRFFELHRRQGMYSRTKVRRNAVNLPGFSSGSDSYNRKRSLDIAAGNRSEKGNSFNVRQKNNDCCDTAGQSFIIIIIYYFIGLDVREQS